MCACCKVNLCGMVGVTHHKAVDVLKEAGNSVTIVASRLVKKASVQPLSNHQPARLCGVMLNPDFVKIRISIGVMRICGFSSTHPDCSHPSCLCSPNSKIGSSPLKGAGVTPGLRDVMAAYHWVYDSRHLQADCQEPGSAPEPCAR